MPAPDFVTDMVFTVQAFEVVDKLGTKKGNILGAMPDEGWNSHDVVSRDGHWFYYVLGFSMCSVALRRVDSALWREIQSCVVERDTNCTSAPGRGATSKAGAGGKWGA